MIDTYSGKFIDAESLNEWLNESLSGFVPKGTTAYIIPRPWEAEGESRFFSEIDINQKITIPQLVSKVVIQHSRGESMHFYADDVVEAAVTEGKLSGTHFYLYCKW